MRLIDLHTDWLLQYAAETTVYDPAHYPSIAGRLGQGEGYLQGTWMAVLSCYRNIDDWSAQPDPWAALGALMTRIEAEFPGRLMIGPDDFARWLDDPEGLCWGMIGIEGFDSLVREPADLARVSGLFARGVRLFQPSYTATGVLAGSSATGDDRGVTELGRAFLETLFELGQESAGPRPLFDLAHLNPRSAGDVLDWFERDERRPRRVIPVYSHGALRHDRFVSARAITLENLSRLRALGGVIGFSVGPPFYDSPSQIQAGITAAAALPFLGRPGFEGIAVGTDFLGVSRTLPGLGNVAEVIAWLSSTFDETTAAALIQGNARALLARAMGALV